MFSNAFREGGGFIFISLLRRSTNWTEISENDKTRLKYNSLPDGEFWMEFDDFQREFHDITIATIGPDFNQDGQEGRPIGNDSPEKLTSNSTVFSTFDG